MLAVIAPALFVVVWSTGFIVARAIDGVADPALFLLARFTLTTLMYAAIAGALRVAWPARNQWPKHLLAGALLQGVYMGGGYWAVAHGLSPAVMALLATLQPMFTALIAQRLFDEPPGRHFWAGLLAGALGVVLVLAPRLASVGPEALSPLVVGVALVAVAGITAGTLVQKSSIAAADLFSSSAIQNAGGALVCLVVALALGESLWVPGPALWAALAWAVFGLSAIGSTLLVWMVRRGSAAKVSVLVLLAPPLAAVQAALLFGERLEPLQMAGFALALGGVLLCRRR